MTIETILLAAALVLFAIPAIRALINSSVDFTNTGLACLIAAMLFG